MEPFWIPAGFEQHTVIVQYSNAVRSGSVVSLSLPLLVVVQYLNAVHSGSVVSLTIPTLHPPSLQLSSIICSYSLLFSPLPASLSAPLLYFSRFLSNGYLPSYCLVLFSMLLDLYFHILFMLIHICLLASFSQVMSTSQKCTARASAPLTRACTRARTHACTRACNGTTPK